MKTIKVSFMDGFNKKNFFANLLSQKYILEFSDNPDYVFYSVYGNNHHKYDCIRIFFTGENVVPNFNYCDYAFGFHHLDFEDRYMRLPLWRMYDVALDKALNKNISDKEALNRKFCAMVVSNTKQTDGYREAFFEKLSEYKTVDSGGKYKNNVGGPVSDKLDFQNGYKFSFAFENVKAKGYCTEKILESFASKTIPIYYGDETVIQDFNPKAFINCLDYPSIDAVIERIKELDKDDEAYLKMLHEPIFIDGKLPEKYSDENILNFLVNIIETPLDKAKRRKMVKHYADVDYIHMKERDARLVIKYYIKKKIARLFGRR